MEKENWIGVRGDGEKGGKEEVRSCSMESWGGIGDRRPSSCYLPACLVGAGHLPCAPGLVPRAAQS